MYADRVTESMRRSIDETNRRREIQTDHNREHGVVPSTIVKEIRDLTQSLRATAAVRPVPTAGVEIPTHEARRLIAELEKQMKTAAGNLEFEKAALLRDEILELRRLMRDQEDVPAWEKYRRFEKV